MTEALASKTCTPCRGGIPPLTRERFSPLARSGGSRMSVPMSALARNAGAQTDVNDPEGRLDL
jgi:hypothetical protein